MTDLMAVPARVADLAIYVVYDKPTDYPDDVVVRCWRARPTGAYRDIQPAARFGDVEQARRWCRARGLVCLSRHESDDPVIVEAWI